MITNSVTLRAYFVRSNFKRYYSLNKMPKPIKVQVKQGIMIGEQNQLANGFTYNSFKGVPYAVPPIGELRFKPPIPLEKFHEPELDCTRERDVSHQYDLIAQEVVGSENCLHLNIYAPHTDSAKRLPVMLWIHGGGFFVGDGNNKEHFPAQLMQEEVIVVTCNYRLGALGFLCLPQADIYGNAGLKDQRLALQWIQENISQFNGDPNNVTLFGESAGACSVHLHVYADHANKLFHKAILQSGTANTNWVYSDDAQYKARKLAALLGCESKNDTEILKFLQSSKVTPMDMLAKTLAVQTNEELRTMLPFVFKPVIELNETIDSPSMLKRPVIDLLKEQDKITMPILMGYNSSEGLTMTSRTMRKLKEVNSDLERLVPRNLPRDSGVIKEIAKRMREFYFNGKDITPDSILQVVQLLSDFHFATDIKYGAKLHVDYQTRSPLYYYRFDYVGERNRYKEQLKMQHLPGAAHGDDICYVFQSYGDNSKVTEDDALYMKRLSHLWANFAKYGDPTPANITDKTLIDFKWLPARKVDDKCIMNYLDFNKEIQMRTDPDKERTQFWESIYNEFTMGDYSIYTVQRGDLLKAHL